MTPPLTDDQKRDVCTIAAVGCERHIAARYLGCRPAELQAQIEADAPFARELEQAEARAELTHVRNVQQAAQDEKHWRASVWWLERRAPQRYGRQDPGAVSPAQVRKFVGELAAIIAEEVQHQEDRDRLLKRLEDLAAELGEPSPSTASAERPSAADLSAKTSSAAIEAEANDLGQP
ncbi:MAG: hypothetical protein AAF790_02560 [Planctomycetota bacterium]